MYYLLWIGESANELRAPTCEIATNTEYSMYEYCKNLIDKYYPEGQYVVMSVSTIPAFPLSDKKQLYSQTTCSVSEFIHNYKEA